MTDKLIQNGIKKKPIITVPEANEEFNDSDITVSVTVKDNGTELDGKTYISGISNVYYSTIELVNPTADDVENLKEKTEITSETEECSFTVTNDFDGKYYIYAM